MVDKVFRELLKKERISGKRFKFLETCFISLSGNYLKPLKPNFQIRLTVGSNRANKQLMSVEQQAISSTIGCSELDLTRFDTFKATLLLTESLI